MRKRETDKEGFLSKQDQGDDSDQLINKVAKRDNYNCQVCSNIVQPRGVVGHTIIPTKPEKPEKELTDYILVCWDCFEDYDDEDLILHLRRAENLTNAKRGFTLLYTRALLKETTERTRLFIYAGRLLLIRRLFAGVGGSVLIFGSGLVLITLVGTLFLGVQTGLQLAITTLSTALHLVRRFGTTPSFIATALGLGYLVHVIERERAYVRHVERQRRRGDPTEAITHARPRWQFVGGFAAIGFVGALDWTLIVTGQFARGSAVGAFVLWSVGAIGVAYFLRETLHEDRDIAGFDVWSTPWVFSSRYTLGVGVVGGICSLLDVRFSVSEPALSLLFWLPPLTGGLYVLRRTVERRTSWRPWAASRWLRTFIVTANDRDQTDSETDPERDNNR